ncbi:MAG: anthranilate phosphoribosyltransferase, partial [Candidatus Gracilibacteria bacterium]|nr:anthranilate phosphoribosyltransferase [Candidatus Gracilibacteria bacterium]
MLHDLLFSLESHRELSPEQIRFFLDESISGKISLAQQAAVLSSLNTKGISSQEMASFAQEIAQKMTHGVNIPDAIDICGTGGSGLDRINTSTISAFILSALGVRIAKHGNRASSGRFGSFDLLEHLKIDIGRGHRDLEQIADQTSLAFLYAPQFHPSMKHFAGVRKELGIPTVFNLLGPLLNPTNPQIQIIGTPFRGLMNLIAETAKRLGKKRVMVVCGEDGLDEVTLSGKTYVTELLHGRIRTTILKPSHFGIASCDFEKIKGSKPAFNTHIALDILKGTCQSRHLDLVLVNTALALKLAGVTSNLRKAYEMAQECVASGNAYQQFIRYHQASHTPSLLLEIVGQKKKEIVLRKRCFSLKRLKKKVEPSTRDFRAAILRQGIGMIAEIKKASPQEGVLRKGRFDVGKLAENFEKVG